MRDFDLDVLSLMSLANLTLNVYSSVLIRNYEKLSQPIINDVIYTCLHMSSFERSIFNTTTILMSFLFLMSLASLPYIIQSSVFMVNYEKLIQPVINYKSINAQYPFNPNVFSFHIFSRKSSFNRLGNSFYWNYEKLIQALISIRYLFQFFPSCLFLSLKSSFSQFLKGI